MTIRDLMSLLDAQLLCGEARLDTPVVSACCSDLMSDVLAFVTEKTVLLTGLTNMHAIRTAEILDLKCVIFARAKMPAERLRVASPHEYFIKFSVQSVSPFHLE